MISIAIPNKGVLSEEAVTLLKEAGYKCKRSSRELKLVDESHKIEFYFLRPRDIAVYVGKGIIDLGITGRDLALDSNADVEEITGLDFGHSKFLYAVPNDQDITPEDFGGKRIATSYASIVRSDLEARNIDAEVVKLDGAVEISIELGVADAIADVVESGRTLREAGLKTIGKPIMESEALIVKKRGRSDSEIEELQIILGRIQGVLVARRYCIVQYDIEKDLLPKAIELTPGIESPTISPLADAGWVAVQAMTEKKASNAKMDQLKAIGAKGILLTDIRACRL